MTDITENFTFVMKWDDMFEEMFRCNGSEGDLIWDAMFFWP